MKGWMKLVHVIPRVDQGFFSRRDALKIFGINIDTRTRPILEEGRKERLKGYSNDTFFEYLDISRHLFQTSDIDFLRKYRVFRTIGYRDHIVDIDATKYRYFRSKRRKCDSDAIYISHGGLELHDI